MKRSIVGVMGPGAGATEDDCRIASELGELIAREGWVLLTGGRPAGVMAAASAGASAAGGLTVGILPGTDSTGVAEGVQIAIRTGLGQARNNVNILTSDVVVACGMGAGTASEVALAIKYRRPLILVGQDPATVSFFQRLGDGVRPAADASEAILIVREVLSSPAARNKFDPSFVSPYDRGTIRAEKTSPPPTRRDR